MKIVDVDEKKTLTMITQFCIFDLLKFEPVFNAYNSYTSSSVKVFNVRHEFNFNSQMVVVRINVTLEQRL